LQISGFYVEKARVVLKYFEKDLILIIGDFTSDGVIRKINIFYPIIIGILI